VLSACHPAKRLFWALEEADMESRSDITPPADTQHGKGTTMKAIAKALQSHRAIVSAWIKAWEHHGVQSLSD